MIELISLALKMNKNTIFNAMIESNVLENTLVLFKTYEWNNLLHNQVEKIFNTIIDGENVEIRTHVLLHNYV